MIAAAGLTLLAGARTLLQRADFAFQPGEFVAVLGPNGAGKTTLLRALAGVRAPEGGRVTVGGREIHAMNAAERARAIAHIAADDVFSDRLTVRDVAGMGRYAHHRWWQWREEPEDAAIVLQSLQSVGMAAFAERRFDTLSSGERQRVWVAVALAQEAPVLLLDEPTSHLDVRVAQEILTLLRAQADGGKTVVCVLHDLNEAAAFADRLMLLADGRVQALDVPERVLTPEMLDRTYGLAMEVLRTPAGALRVFPRNGHGLLGMREYQI